MVALAVSTYRKTRCADAVRFIGRVRGVVGLTTVVAALLLAGCAGQPAQRADISCRQSLDHAYERLNYAKAKGFAGTVSYSKAAGLLAAAKVQQQLENYRDCVAKADKAHFYIKQSQNK